VDSWNFWLHLATGYGLGVLVETPILLVALARRHSWRTRLFAGVWLTACTYPIVALALPALINPSSSWPLYVTAAETFAPGAECLLFCLLFDWGSKVPLWTVGRDCAAIVLANLASFGTGLLVM
jgi:hypothetical protein